jgi:hypothetical protein
MPISEEYVPQRLLGEGWGGLVLWGQAAGGQVCGDTSIRLRSCGPFGAHFRRGLQRRVGDGVGGRLFIRNCV